MGHPVKAEAAVSNAVWKRFMAVDHAMRLFILQFSSHLYTLLGSHSLYALDDGKRIE